MGCHMMIPKSLLLGHSRENGFINYDSFVLSELLTSSTWVDKEDTQLLEMVLNYEDITTVNWGAVSEQMKKSPQECFSRYHNRLSPSINISEWQPDEDERLSQLVNTYGPYNWVFLSGELGTNRSPIECLRHFQRFLNSEKISHSDWTKDEDYLLKEATDKHGLSWDIVSEYLPKRSATQCMNRYRKSVECHNDVISGKWTEMEERKLFVLAQSFGIPMLSQRKAPPDAIDALFREGKIIECESLNDQYADEKFNGWVHISEILTGKTSEQCREKWTNTMDPTISQLRFSEEEKKALSILVAYFGEGEWSKIARYLPGRTDAYVRRRWFQIKQGTSSS